MKIYRALVNIYDLNGDENKVIVNRGDYLIFEDKSRAEKAIQKNVVKEVNVYELKGSLDEEEKAEDPEELKELKVSELRERLDEQGIKYNAKDTKDILINLLKK